MHSNAYENMLALSYNTLLFSSCEKYYHQPLLTGQLKGATQRLLVWSGSSLARVR